MTRLIVVTLLLAVVAVVLKSRSKGTKYSRTIKVTSRVTINRGAMVAVVEVDGRRLLVGASATQVNLLSELADGESLDDPGSGEAPAPAPTLASSVASKLSGLRSRPTLRTEPVAATEGAFLDKVRAMTVRTAEPKLRLPNRGGAT